MEMNLKQIENPFKSWTEDRRTFKTLGKLTLGNKSISYKEDKRFFECEKYCAMGWLYYKDVSVKEALDFNTFVSENSNELTTGGHRAGILWLNDELRKPIDFFVEMWDRWMEVI
jgi:hypothetical protein